MRIFKKFYEDYFFQNIFYEVRNKFLELRINLLNWFDFILAERNSFTTDLHFSQTTINIRPEQ